MRDDAEVTRHQILDWDTYDSVGHVEGDYHITDVITNYGHGEILGRTLVSYSQLAYECALVP